MGRTLVGCVWLAACGLSAATAAAQAPGAAFPPAPAQAVAPPASATAPTPQTAPPAPTPAPVAPAPAAPNAVAPAPAPPPAQPAPVAGPPPYPGPNFFSTGYAFPEPPRPVYPEDSAVQSSPFLGATVSLVSLEDRFTDPLVIGISFGGYIARAVRLVARIEMPSTDDTENYYESTYPGYTTVQDEPPTLLYGGSLGIVAAHSQSLVFAPGVMFLRSDVSAYGNMVGVSIPFDWTTNRGLRFGLEVGFGRSFGGTSRQRCTYSPSCENGDEVTTDREAARAFTLRFELGFGFNHPKPEQPEYSQPPSSGWAPAGGAALPPPAFQAQPAAPLPAPLSQPQPQPLPQPQPQPQPPAEPAPSTRGF